MTDTKLTEQAIQSIETMFSENFLTLTEALTAASCVIQNIFYQMGASQEQIEKFYDEAKVIAKEFREKKTKR